MDQHIKYIAQVSFQEKYIAQLEKPADGRSLLFSNISLIAKQHFHELLYNFL